jgi:hypothetical protein
MIVRRAAALTLALAGCPYIPADVHQANIDDTFVPPDGPEITLVEPMFGTTGFRETIRIVGAPRAAGTPVVRFGDAPARVLAQLDDGSTFEVIVETPPLPEPGPVDVTVGVEGGFTVVEGFEVWPSEAGKVGAIASFLQRERVPSDFDPAPTPPADQTIVMQFVEPSTLGPAAAFVPTLDTCVAGRNGTGLTPRATGYTEAVFEADGAPDTVTLTSIDGGSTFEGVFGPERPNVWNLVALNGSTDWPTMELPMVALLPSELAWMAPAAVGGQPVPRAAFFFEWDFGGTGDTFVLIDVQPLDGTWFFRCAAVDDGRFRVPPSAFPSWLEGDLVTASIGRVRVIDTSLRTDRSLLRTWSGTMFEAELQLGPDAP